MDLVSFETADEYRHFAKIMFRGNIVIVIVSQHANFEDDKLHNAHVHICKNMCLHIDCLLCSFIYSHTPRASSTIAMNYPIYKLLSTWSKYFCRQYHLYVDQWTKVQLPEQGLWVIQPPASQYQRLVLGWWEQEVINNNNNNCQALVPSPVPLDPNLNPDQS